MVGQVEELRIDERLRLLLIRICEGCSIEDEVQKVQDCYEARIDDEDSFGMRRHRPRFVFLRLCALCG